MRRNEATTAGGAVLFLKKWARESFDAAFGYSSERGNAQNLPHPVIVPANQVKAVPAALHKKIAHYGERATTALRMKGKGMVGKAFLGLFIWETFNDFGNLFASPLGGADTMGDATISGSEERKLYNSKDPEERLKTLRNQKENYGLNLGFEELQRRESLEQDKE